jgi:hypothetical protein
VNHIEFTFEVFRMGPSGRDNKYLIIQIVFIGIAYGNRY